MGVRVFNVKLGEDVMLNIDIFKNAGAKRPLTKYFEFGLEREVVFVNKTIVRVVLSSQSSTAMTTSISTCCSPSKKSKGIPRSKQ